MGKGSSFTICNVVPDALYESFKDRCNNALAKLGLEPTQTALPLLGTRPLDKKSVQAYTGRIRRLVAFLLREGYDQSLLPFYPYTPKGTVTVEEEAMVAFLYAVYTPFGEVVHNMHSRPLKNPQNEEILGMGVWNDPDILDQLRSATTHVLVNGHGHGQTYWNMCKDCCVAASQNIFSGCKYHSPCRLVTSGNVMGATSVRDTINYIRDKSHHVVSGACHLLPSHVRQIREYAASSNDIYWMEIYVLLLMSIELFLRKMEYSSLTVDNFNTNMFVMSDEYVVEAFNLKVKGKKKRKKKKKATNDTYPCWRSLYVWGDDQYPDIDLKRHLMAFLYCLEWKGGTLFPTKAEIYNPPSDGIYKTTMSEEDLYSSLKYLSKTVLKRNDKLTSHSGRKSGYLWNRIRGADAHQLMTAACHDVYEVAVKYAKDCDAITKVLEVFQDKNNQLGMFKSCYCAGDETAVDSAAPGRKYQKPLADIVVGFMELRVGICPSDPKCRHPRDVMERILSWNKPHNNIETLKGHLRDISSDKSKAIMGCVINAEREAYEKAKTEFGCQVEEKVQSRLQEILGLVKTKLVSGQISESDFDLLLRGQFDLSPSIPITPSPIHPKKYDDRRGNKTLPPRDGFRKWSPEDKLVYIVDNYDSNHKLYVNSDRQWLLRAFKTYKCFTTCCEKKVEVFLEKYGKGNDFSLTAVAGCQGCIDSSH